MPECPICEGAGKLTVHVYYGPGKGGEWKRIPCDLCEGVGALSDERQAAYEAGQELKAKRRAAGLTLMQAAEMQGLTPSEISRMERGLPAKKEAPRDGE